MALFRRRKTDQSALPEVDKYYDGERRDRAGLAWVLAFASVAIAALIFVGLFYAGRWAYREITGNDSTNETAQTNDSSDAPSVDGGPQDGTSENGGQSDGAGSGSNGEGSTQGDNGQSSESTNGSGSNQGQGSDEQASSGSVDAPASTTTPSNEVLATGDNPTDLPHTGPAGVIALASSVSVVAGGVHYAASRRTKRN